MASYYVYSAAAGAANGTSWADAYTTLAAAVSGKAAGDTFYIAHDHDETTAGAVTVTSPGPIANPCRFLSVNRAGSVPPVAADLQSMAGIIRNSGNSAIVLNGAGGYWEGLVIRCGVGATGASTIQPGATNDSAHKFKNCQLKCETTHASVSSGIFTGGTAADSAYVHLDNVQVSFGSVSQAGVTVRGKLLWENTADALQGSICTNVVRLTGDYGVDVVLRALDLDAAGSGKTLIGSTLGPAAGRVQIIDCDIDDAVTIAATPLAPGGHRVDVFRTAGTGLNYTFRSYQYAGTLTEEATIVRTGGAAQPDGTGYAWKIVTTANANWFFPFEVPAIRAWNKTVGSAITVTVECRAAAVPNDDEVWLEVEYLSASGSPLGGIVSDTKATVLTAAAAQASSSETWGGSTASFKIAVTFTPQQAGLIIARPKAGKASYTVYVDPKLTIG